MSDTQQPSDPVQPEETHNGDMQPILRVYRGDITRINVQCIVNAANSRLRGGGGVDGAIHRAAGPGLLTELKKSYPNGCNTTDACISKAHNLQYPSHIIHTVGPIVKEIPTPKSSQSQLKVCYENCLNCAGEHGLTSIAFPCISTGVFGYPSEEAAPLVVETCQNWMSSNPKSSVKNIVFVTFMQEDTRLYEDLLEQETDIGY